MDPRTMTGLELLKATQAGKFPPPSMALTIPMMMETIESGRIVFTATPDTRHLNPLGAVHGGFAATVLDSVTGCAVHSRLEAGIGFATVDFAIKMIRPLQPGVTYRAEGLVMNMTRSFGFAEGRIFDGDQDKLFAHATATCAIIYPKKG